MEVEKSLGVNSDKLIASEPLQPLHFLHHPSSTTSQHQQRFVQDE
jgi:hypothetical protein